MTRLEVRKDGKTYMQGETETPPSKDLLRELLTAGYAPYVNGRKVTRSSLQPRKGAK